MVTNMPASAMALLSLWCCKFYGTTNVTAAREWFGVGARVNLGGGGGKGGVFGVVVGQGWFCVANVLTGNNKIVWKWSGCCGNNGEVM